MMCGSGQGIEQTAMGEHEVNESSDRLAHLQARRLSALATPPAPYLDPLSAPKLNWKFEDYFDIVQADSPSLRLECYRIRYQVYCCEVGLTGFDALDYPDDMETDAFDNQAAHCLLRHRPSSASAGTVRLIMNKPQHARQYFPIEEAISAAVPCHPLEQRGIARAATGEISRFILTRRFRSRPGEWRWPDGVTPSGDRATYARERRNNLHPILGLVRAALLVSAQQGIRYWFAGMEPRLDRRLNQFGIVLDPISPLINYHGICKAHFAHIPTMLRRVYAYNAEVWALLTDSGRVWPLE